MNPARSALTVVSSAVAVLVLSSGCGSSSRASPLANSKVTTSTKATSSTQAPPSTVAVSTTTSVPSTTPVTVPRIVAPNRTGERVAPVDQRLEPYLLSTADWAGSYATTLAAADFNMVVTPFSPCGYRFDDTATASGRASIVLVVPQPQNRPLTSGLVYIDEDLAAYPSIAAAAQIAAGFRAQGDSCPSDPSVMGIKYYQDIPYLSIGGTTWQEAPALLPPVGDDRFAVRISKSNGGYYLALVRKGRYVAFMRAGDETLSEETLQLLVPLVRTAAGRMPNA